MTDDPRLELADVEKAIAALPGSALGELAQGPLPGKLCRVCGVLRPLTEHVAASIPPEAGEAAKKLMGWHEFFEETPALDELTKAWRDRPTEDERHEHRKALGEWRRHAGMLGYARRCTIYLAARVELERTTRP